LPFSLYLVALRHTPAAVSALYLPLIPVSGLLTAHILLGETLAGGQWAGAALIIISVLGISWQTLRRP
jgi:drug/metabolite transporter (DMT)-like permease